MSGIVGIVRVGGAPVDSRELRRLTQSLTTHAPDGHSIRLLKSAGFGHALLRTAAKSTPDQQPLTLGGQVWIVADARLDGRDELGRSLEARGHHFDDGEGTDAQLILGAYGAWGKDCVDHLLGDFAFAIWDEGRQTLFCARDHLGIKPFFYSLREHLLVFSNNLNTVRLHPRVRDEVDERVVGDHLILGGNIRPEAKFFADIRCLPPGHSLALRGENLRVSRYLTLSDIEPTRYRKAEEYVEHFRALFDTAVAERIQSPSVGVLMSGGLDSTSVAATAHRLLQTQPAAGLQLWTIDPGELIENDERDHADLVSRALGVPHYYLREEEYRIYERYQTAGQGPASVEGPFAATIPQPLQRMAPGCRVALMGHNENVLHFPREYVLDQLKSLRIAGLLGNFRQYHRMHQRLPRLRLLRETVKRHAHRWGWRRGFPSWLNPDFERRIQGRQRWESMWRDATAGHSRIESYLRSRTNYFPHWMEALDPGQTHAPVEVRQPLADMRLVRFVLSIPAVPWCVDRVILREAMRGRLPERVRLRPKTIINNPRRLRIHLDRDRDRWKSYLGSVPGLENYVSIPAAEKAIQRLDAKSFATAYVIVAPLSLAVWLSRIR